MDSLEISRHTFIYNLFSKNVEIIIEQKDKVRITNR